jgi:ABC-type antimicrobial peptide transport system permease subunit
MSHGMEVYFPHRRNRGGGFYSILARSNRDPDVTIASVRQSIWSMDPRIPIDAMPMTTRIGESLYRQRFFVRLSSAFTVIAALLAIIGVYGTTAYWVARRRRELAIRIAVGASPRTIVAAVIARGIRLAAVGGAVGLAIAWAGARLIQSLLFKTDARDPATLAMVTLLLFAAAIVACAIPALRAARVDPITTLRAE